jgi:calcineurin-like phosphoesterase family protein
MRESQTWFTSDTHYGHKRIIELCRRPFASVEAMDDFMVDMHNRFVQPITCHIWNGSKATCI